MYKIIEIVKTVIHMFHSEMNTNNSMPYFVPVPPEEKYSIGIDTIYVAEHPTRLMEDRFQKWHDIVTGLTVYLREVAYTHEQNARMNLRLQERAVNLRCLTDLNDQTNTIYEPIEVNHPKKRSQNVPIIQQKQNQYQEKILPDPVYMVESRRGSALSGFMEFGTGSIQDLQVVLKKYHSSVSNHEYKISKEILQCVVPNIEALAKELRKYRKEIKLLSGDFKTNLEEHRATLKKSVNRYNEMCKNDFTCNDPCADPFLLRKQLSTRYIEHRSEERHLREAYINLQETAMKLEKTIVIKIQYALERYCNLIEAEARLILKNLCHELKQGILDRKPLEEWDHFVENHPSALLPLKSGINVDQLRGYYSTHLLRNMVLVYPQSKNIKNGYLLSKMSANKSIHTQYRKSLFVITARFIHEFPIDHTKQHHSTAPKYSFPLDSCKLESYTAGKFILTTDTVYCLKHNANREQYSRYKGLLMSTLFGNQTASVVKKEEYTRVYTPTEPKNISFKLPDSNMTSEDALKRWINTIKRLTSFRNVTSRVAYLTERMDDIQQAYDRTVDNAGLVRMNNYIISEIASGEQPEGERQGDDDNNLSDYMVDPLVSPNGPGGEATTSYIESTTNVKNSSSSLSTSSLSSGTNLMDMSNREGSFVQPVQTIVYESSKHDTRNIINKIKEQAHSKTNKDFKIKLTKSIYS